MTGEKAPEEVLEVVDGAPFADLLEERFAIPAAALDPFLVFRAGARLLAIAPRALRLPERPRPAAVGLPFFYHRMRHPRPATATAARFGGLARRNVVDLSDAQLAAFVGRREVALDTAQQVALTGTGYVLGRYRGVVLGVGLYRVAEAGAWICGSLPKLWGAELGL